jgi:hypothetical protein
MLLGLLALTVALAAVALIRSGEHELARLAPVSSNVSHELRRSRFSVR